MKGNEAIAHAAIRCGTDGFFGYPITPQSEIIETLSELKPWETTGMVVLQAESEVASINMVYGGGGAGNARDAVSYGFDMNGLENGIPDSFEYPTAWAVPESGTPATISGLTLSRFARFLPQLYLICSTLTPS